jgi:hypothetical protein
MLKEFKPEIGVSFEANGKKYTIEKNLSIARAISLNKIEIEITHNVTVEVLKKELVAVYNSLNKGNFADSSVKVYNLANGIDKITKIEEMPILRLCALFINEENEDRRTITDEQISTKINDWQTEGLMIEPFFTLAISLLPNVHAHYKQLIQRFSEAEKKQV